MTELRSKMIQQMQIKGYSTNSIDAYIDALAALAKHFRRSPDELSIDQIREYMQNCLEVRKLSRSWANQLVSALKILFCEVLHREWSDLSIPRPRRVKKLPVVLSREEVQRMFSCTINLKHRCLLILIYSSGLRLSELRNLRVTDIDSSRMQIRIRQAKGFKDRYAVLSSQALLILREYYRSMKPHDVLFRGEDEKPISERQIQWIFKSALRKAGIQKKAAVHSLRHSFATHMMEQGVSLPIIQQLLGHKSLRTTSIYLHVQQYSLDSVKSPFDSFPV